MSVTGMLLLQDAAERILVSWMTAQGRLDARTTDHMESLGRGVDITYAWQGGQHRIKVKPDPYFGTDSAKINDRSLPFYRAEASAFAFEAVANAATREPGWMFDSSAVDLYYYFLALPQTEDEVRALMGEPDEVFFSELVVERDELVVLPMRGTRLWFEANFERYTPRPVMVGGASAWYRLVPRADIIGSVAGINSVGPVFASVNR